MLTFFADDSIGTWEVHNIADLKKAFAGIETIITLFNDYGMKLSNDKCVILYDLQGREAHKFLSKRKHRRNKTSHFKFQQMGEDLWVPIKKCHEYLGDNHRVQGRTCKNMCTSDEEGKGSIQSAEKDHQLSENCQQSP